MSTTQLGIFYAALLHSVRDWPHIFIGKSNKILKTWPVIFGKQKYFPTNYEFTAEEYKQIHTLETTSDKKWHLKLSELQLKVKETIEQTNPFNFDEF